VVVVVAEVVAAAGVAFVVFTLTTEADAVPASATTTKIAMRAIDAISFRILSSFLKYFEGLA
jgi:hypothetical protein